MKPKNSKERRNSFLKFLLIFLLTAATIVTAVFFNFQIPKKENAVLKEESLRMREEIKFQKEFVNGMQDVSKMLDSLIMPGANVAFEKAEIGKKLSDLRHSIPAKDSTYNYELYENIINTFVKLEKTETRLIDVRDTEEEINDFEIALKKCDEEILRLQRDLQVALRR